MNPFTDTSLDIEQCCKFANSVLYEFWNYRFYEIEKILDSLFEIDIIGTLRYLSFDSIRALARRTYFRNNLWRIESSLMIANTDEYHDILDNMAKCDNKLLEMVLIEEKKEEIWEFLLQSEYGVTLILKLPKTRFYLNNKKFKEIVAEIFRKRFKNANGYEILRISRHREIQRIIKNDPETKFHIMTEYNKEQVLSLCSLKIGIEEAIYAHLSSDEPISTLDIEKYKVKYYQYREGYIIAIILNDNEEVKVLPIKNIHYSISDNITYYIGEEYTNGVHGINRVIEMAKYRTDIKSTKIIKSIIEGAIEVWRKQNEKRNLT